MSKKDSLSRKIFYIFDIILMLLMCVAVLFPYLNTMAKAFNDGQDTMRGGITIFPRVFTLENFQAVLRDDSFWSSAFITVLTVVVGTVLGLLTQFLAAYVLLNKNLYGHKFWLILIMIPRYISGGLIACYIYYANIGMLNNFWVYILPGMFSVYNMIIIRSYLSSIPSSLAESARVDGANDITIAFRIIMPLSKPVLATVALWLAVAHWNDWTTTLYYVTDRNLYKLQYVLMQVMKETEKIQAIIKDAEMNGIMLNITPKVTTESIRSAQLILTTIPIVCVYPFVQKYFISGVTLGAVKS